MRSAAPARLGRRESAAPAPAPAPVEEHCGVEALLVHSVLDGALRNVDGMTKVRVRRAEVEVVLERLDTSACESKRKREGEGSGPRARGRPIFCIFTNLAYVGSSSTE